MTNFSALRRMSGAALLLFAAVGTGCRDPQATYSFDAGAPDAGAGGKAGGSAGGAGGAAGRAGTGGITASGGIIGSGSGGFPGTGSGGFPGTGSGGSPGAGSGGRGGASGGAAGAGSGTGGATAGSGGQTGTGNVPGSGGTTPGTGGTLGNGGATANGGSSAGGNGGATAAGGAGGSSSNGGASGGQVVLSDAALLAAADFELNSEAALAAYLDCDPSKLSGDTTVMDANGNSWGPNTLKNQAQREAFANLIHAIFQSIGTADAAGSGGTVGQHGWPDLNPRLTGVATNARNNGAGNRAINGGLLGYGADPAALASGTLNGELAGLYKAAAIADGLTDSSGNPLTPSSSNADFGAAIAHVSTSQVTAVGMANNVAQCAFTISIGIDDDAVVLANPTTFTHNVVEDL